MNSYEPPPRIEDIRLKAYAQGFSKAVFKQYDPYSPCICGSGYKFRFCCQRVREHSKAWAMTLDKITGMLEKKRLKARMEAVE